MYLSNKDLKLLLTIENELWNSGSNLYFDLWRLNEKMIEDKEKRNKKVAKRIKKKRKSNPLYGRSKKEIEQYLKNHVINS